MNYLKEREKTHGRWATQTMVAANLFSSLSAQKELQPTLSEAMHMICVKLSRIACGDSRCEDHWRDIAGYATLAADAMAEPETKNG